MLRGVALEGIWPMLDCRMKNTLRISVYAMRLGACSVLIGAVVAEVSAQRGVGKSGVGGSFSIQPYWESINRWSTQFGVDAALVAAVMKIESDGNSVSLSKSGAMGLMQLMPGTCYDFGVIDPYNPDQNIYGGTALLARNLRRYQGDITKTLAAYNAGPRHADDGSWTQIAETRKYVPAVLARYNEFLAEGWAGSAIPKTGDQPSPIPSVSTLPTYALIQATSENSTDMMFEVVRSSQSQINSEGIGENGVLDNAAADVLQRIQLGKQSWAQIEKVAEQFVSRAKFGAKTFKVLSFSTAAESEFGSAWAKQANVPGRFVGLAHGMRGKYHQWVVIIASK